jgi:hypothetical protein
LGFVGKSAVKRETIKDGSIGQMLWGFGSDHFGKS